MATSEQLEREAEATRARIAATLDELRGRMTPGQLVDEVVDYARDSGGGDFLRNFGRQVAGNPLPVPLGGAGPARAVGGGPKGAAGAGARGGRGAGVSDMVKRMGEGAGDVKRMGEGFGDAAAATRDQTSAAVADLGAHAARRGHDWARQTRATAARLGESAGEAGASLQE